MRVLAHRILKNLELIKAQESEPPFSDTQLILSMLGVVIFSYERTPDALGELFETFDGKLDHILKIVYPDNQSLTIKDLPSRLRHSIAHFNLRPRKKDDRFVGLRIWNRHNGKIDFVADLDFDAFRPLAVHILKSLASDDLSFKIDDPPDPMVEVATY